ncbi:MAG: hypothetical protein JSV01_05420 [Desulfobacterales bacterium]|nr:MAG: hypothetical protein JSV01_05420 [Desulfobacterales bacterium]
MTQLTVPLYHVGLLLALSTSALLFGRLKLALLVNYLFVLYWGYIFNRELLVGSDLEGLDRFTMLYFGFGFLTIISAVIGFLARCN